MTLDADEKIAQHLRVVDIIICGRIGAGTSGPFANRELIEPDKRRKGIPHATEDD